MGGHFSRARRGFPRVGLQVKRAEAAGVRCINYRVFVAFVVWLRVKWFTLFVPVGLV